MARRQSLAELATRGSLCVLSLNRRPSVRATVVKRKTAKTCEGEATT
jgi:hypothetical protein